MSTTPRTSEPSSARAGMLVAVCVGAVAFAVSAYALSTARPKSVQVVRLKAAMPAGQLLTEDDIEPVWIPEVSDGLTRTMVAWELHELVIGRASRRALVAGAPLMWGDLAVEPEKLPLEETEAALAVNLDQVPHDPTKIRVGDHLTFDIATPKPARAGPFRVIAVSIQAGTATVTIAIPWGRSDDPSALLRQAMAREMTGARVTAVIIQPAAAHRKPPERREQ